jgi:hypothetical protein
MGQPALARRKPASTLSPLLYSTVTPPLCGTLRNCNSWHLLFTMLRSAQYLPPTGGLTDTHTKRWLLEHPMPRPEGHRADSITPAAIERLPEFKVHPPCVL